MEQGVNVQQGKNLVCKHRNEISKDIQNQLKTKVNTFINIYFSKANLELTPKKPYFCTFERQLKLGKRPNNVVI